jgi:hypothetical protein
MHKHRKSGYRAVTKRRNANCDLPESASTYITGLLGELGCESSFAVEYLSSEYLSKYLDEKVTPAETRKTNAINKWLATEERNKVTNFILEHRDPGYNILPRIGYSRFLRFARKIIADVLGPLHDKIVLGSFSGGASTSRRRLVSSPAFKFTGQADTTVAALPFVDIIYREAPMLRQFGVFDYLQDVEGSILFTVPKKTDIDRCACKEPDLNMYLQKGVGSHIRKRLQRFGINLNDQSINRRLAALGALDDSLATLDLSSASDTISIGCVEALLPTEWFEYLNDIRSHSVLVNGKYHRMEMFSSMGNGFTFELESLIFWALARTTLYFESVSGVVSVYGDDIICPSQGADMVSWVLQEFGFAVNPDKSFITGPFRESCGGHYHLHEDVTPFYLKRKATRLTDVIRVANQLRRWALADPMRQYLVPSTYKVWTQLASFVPRDLWGGCDLALDTSLVTPHLPNKQLVRLSEKRKEPQVGLYLHWHNSTWKRTSDPDQPSQDPVNTTMWCNKRKVQKGAPYPIDLFHEELVDGSGLE